MSEENKYYTPSIEEFHIGFDYQYYVATTSLWHDQSIVFIEDFEEIEEDLSYNKIRVKYLDQSDLEEIGFKHVEDKMVGDIGQLFTLNNGRYFVHLEYTIFSSWASIKIETSVYENSTRTLVVHSIRIKNKLELKKVMQMLLG